MCCLCGVFCTIPDCATCLTYLCQPSFRGTRCVAAVRKTDLVVRGRVHYPGISSFALEFDWKLQLTRPWVCLSQRWVWTANLGEGWWGDSFCSCEKNYKNVYSNMPRVYTWRGNDWSDWQELAKGGDSASQKHKLPPLECSFLVAGRCGITSLIAIPWCVHSAPTPLRHLRNPDLRYWRRGLRCTAQDLRVGVLAAVVFAGIGIGGGGGSTGWENDASNATEGLEGQHNLSVKEGTKAAELIVTENMHLLQPTA